MEVNYIDPEDIEIGDRFRKENDLSDDFLDSIVEKGFIQPITINQDMMLVAGGRRLEAAKQLKISIPYIMRQTEDELDLRECEFIENAFRKDLEWQERNAIVSRIHDLMKEKYGDKWTIRRSAELIGRSAGGIMRCLQMHEECEKFPVLANLKTEDEAVKLMRKAKEKMASKILAEEHKERTEAYFKGTDKKEYNLKIQSAMYATSHFNIGDAFDGMQEMLDNKLNPPISFVEVDPPYAIDLKEVKKGDKDRKLDKYEEISKGKYPEFIRKLCTYLYEVTPANTRICFWFGIEWYNIVRNNLTAAGFKVDPIPCLWTKRAGQTNAPDLYLARAWEPFFIASKGEGIPIRNRGRINVFDFPVVPASRKYHPTQRPIELMQEILRTFAWEGCIIMVPFLGSGATLLAA
ncbi:hypothetical protein LCGC14_2152200, partial [marine sediment metagenome]